MPPPPPPDPVGAGEILPIENKFLIPSKLKIIKTKIIRTTAIIPAIHHILLFFIFVVKFLNNPSFFLHFPSFLLQMKFPYLRKL